MRFERLTLRLFASRPVNWPGQLANLSRPGLYSWWVDREGAADLSAGLGHRVRPGRIYAGQTGATKWPSGTIGQQPSRPNRRQPSPRSDRGIHVPADPCLDPDHATGANQVDSKHLDAHPSSGSATGCESTSRSRSIHLPTATRSRPRTARARQLDPPLNLDGMAMTPVRGKLAKLRAGDA